MLLKRTIRPLSVLVCLCLLGAMVSGMAITARAAETELPEGMIIGDQDGIRVDAHGHYYLDLRDLMPGDVFRKTITIQNLSQNSAQAHIPYRVVMGTEPLETTGPVDLLDKVRLTLELDGVVVYEGRSRGDGKPDMTKDALDLGEYAVGQRRILKATLAVAEDMPVHEEISEADFRWLFYAYRDTEELPPKTGLADNYALLLPTGGVALLLAVLLLLKRRRDRQGQECPA